MNMKQALAIILLSTIATGCMSFSDRSMRDVRNSISAQLPDIRLEKEVAVALGGGLFNFLDILTMNEADLSEIDHLQLAVYQVLPRGGEANFTDELFKQSLLAKDADLTWERIVRVLEEGERVWVFVGMNLDRQLLQAVSVFIVESGDISDSGSEQLVLINMDGDLNELLEHAFSPARGHPGAFTSS